MTATELFTSCRVRALWWDRPDPPNEGDYLMHQDRAYKIEHVRQADRNPILYVLRCTRWPLDQIPMGARVIHWRWAITTER